MGLENISDGRIDVIPWFNQPRIAVKYPAPTLGLKTISFIECTVRDYGAAQSNRHLSAHAAHGG